VISQNEKFDMTAVDEHAYKRSVRYSTKETADYLVRVIGPQMVAVGTGVKDVRTVRGWQDHTEPRSQEVEDRLRILLRVVTMVKDTYGDHAARAFLRGSNATLGDKAPLMVVARSTDPTGSSILGAVRGFLEE
jgi:uncharacterized protein (DUF2384 family)